MESNTSHFELKAYIDGRRRKKEFSGNRHETYQKTTKYTPIIDYRFGTMNNTYFDGSIKSDNEIDVSLLSLNLLTDELDR